MNSRGLTAIVVVVGGMLVALFVIVSILSGAGFGNVLGATYKYFLPAAFVLGVAAPRFSMYFLLLCGVYIDFLKKLMAVDYTLYFSDVFYILGVPPVLLLGMCCGILANVAQGRIPLDMRLLKLFLLATAVVIAFSVTALMKTGLNMTGVKELANTAAYYGLIFALPALFPTLREVIKLLRFFVLIMIPAALHGLGHHFFGLAPFEETYMLSGLTMNVEYVLTGEGIFGPFASQGALAGSATIAASVCAIPFLVRKEMMRGVKFPKRWLCFLLIMLFLVTAVLSLKRSPIIVFPFSVIGFFLIRNRFGTAFAYAGALSATVTLILMSETIADRLPEWQDRVYDVIDQRNTTNVHLFRIRTLNTRMEDFAYLKKSENWEPFGVDWFKGYDSGDYGVHSLAVKIFLRFGWVPLSVALLFLLPVAWFLHRRLLRRVNTLQQQVFVFATALPISMFLAAALGASFLNAFPIPLFFGMFVSIGVSMGIFPVAARKSAPVREERRVEPLRSPVPDRA